MTDATVPKLGLGTSGNTDPEQCKESVRTALEMGYRHVDTAQMYDNEAAVGDGIAAADVPREEVTVATKVLPSNLAREDVLETVPESLDRLGLETVDLLYVHWPMRAYDPEETLAAFDEVHERGLTRHVAVSNFSPELLDEARDLLSTPPVANQVEMHPLLPQEELVAYAERHGLTIVAYAPLGQGEIFDEPALQAVAERHDATPAQVSLAWLADHDVVAPIPKATGEAHIGENYEALDLELTDEDRAEIDAIDRRERLVDPDGAPWNA